MPSSIYEHFIMHLAGKIHLFVSLLLTIAVRGNLLTALLLSKVSFHLKPERLHFDVTGGEALGQNIAPSPAPAWKAVPPASHGTAFQAAGSNNPLIPRAWPSVTKSKALQAFCPLWHFQAPSNLILLQVPILSRVQTMMKNF